MAYTYKEKIIRTKNKRISYWIGKRYEGGKLLFTFIDIMHGFFHEMPQPKLKEIYNSDKHSKKEFDRLMKKIKKREYIHD